MHQLSSSELGNRRKKLQQKNRSNTRRVSPLVHKSQSNNRKIRSKMKQEKGGNGSRLVVWRHFPHYKIQQSWRKTDSDWQNSHLPVTCIQTPMIRSKLRSRRAWCLEAAAVVDLPTSGGSRWKQELKGC